MARQNDQVFQLSLTEIAFTITFLLLLLLGYLVHREQTEKLEAQTRLATLEGADRTIFALNGAKQALANALEKQGSPNPDETISKLVAAEQAREERDRLRQQVEDLDAKLTAMTELRELIAKASTTGKVDQTQEEVLSAIALQDQVRKAIEQTKGASKGAGQSAADKPARAKEALSAVKEALATSTEFKSRLKADLNREVRPGEEPAAVREVVSAAKSFGELRIGGQNPEAVRKENSDLRGQVAFLKNRLDARGGRDFPPCWADESGKVEFLFAIEVKPDSVTVSPAWPARREASARALPGIDAVLAGPHSNQEFASRIQGVYNWSKTQDPECRHYVQLKSSIPDAVQSDRARLMVEGFFYKVEVRR